MLKGKSLVTAHKIREKIIKNYEVDQSIIINKNDSC